MSIPPYLATKGTIGIRPYRPKDTKPFYKAIIASLEYITRYLAWEHKNYALEDARGWIESRSAMWERGEQYSFLVYSVKDGQFLGSMDIDRIENINKIANLGYWIGQEVANRSIATTAAEMVVKFAFRELKLNRLEIITDIANIASRRVAEKLGAKKEGILRNRFFHHDQIHAAVMYSLILEDIHF